MYCSREYLCLRLLPIPYQKKKKHRKSYCRYTWLILSEGVRQQPLGLPFCTRLTTYASIRFGSSPRRYASPFYSQSLNLRVRVLSTCHSLINNDDLKTAFGIHSFVAQIWAVLPAGLCTGPLAMRVAFFACICGAACFGQGRAFVAAEAS